VNSFLEQEAGSSFRKIVGVVCGIISILFLGIASTIIVMANHILLKDIGVLLTTIIIVCMSALFGYLSYRLTLGRRNTMAQTQIIIEKRVINWVGFFIFALSSISAIALSTLSTVGQNQIVFIMLGVLSAWLAWYLLKR